MKPPVYYLGGKGRIASSIVDTIAPTETFVDICCGSGAVFLEVAARGVVPVSQITALDGGPWGDVWSAVGRGVFPHAELTRYAAAYAPETWQHTLDDISTAPDLAAFVLTQAGQFGGLALDWTGTAWGPRRPRKMAGAGHLPSVPQPSVVVSRMQKICEKLHGMSAARVMVSPELVSHTPRGWCVYIDPPYKGTAGYGRVCDYMGVASAVGGAWISEAVPLSEKAIRMSANRRALAGTTHNPREEWLSFVK